MVAGIDDLAMVVVSKGAGPVVSKLLEVLIPREKETIKMLRDVKLDVAAILHGPFNTGMAYLREASAAAAGSAMQIESLRLARQEFMRALGQEHKPLIRGEAAIYIATIWVALNEPANARSYALQAAGEIDKGLYDLLYRVNDDLGIRFGTLESILTLKLFKARDASLDHQLEDVVPRRINEANRLAIALGADANSLQDSVVVPVPTPRQNGEENPLYSRLSGVKPYHYDIMKLPVQQVGAR